MSNDKSFVVRFLKGCLTFLPIRAGRRYSLFVISYLMRSYKIKSAPKSSRAIAKKISEFCSDKKAEDVVLLDMRKIVNFCDFFVICSGNTDRHLKAIADGIQDGLKDIKINVKYNRASKDASWVVFDIGDIVVHIFRKDVREFYNLEHLWQDAAEVKV